MPMCTRHSHDLLQFIRRKGMADHVSATAEDAQRKARRWLQGQTSRDDFDPYVIATLELNQKAGMIFAVPSTPHCTLCVVEHQGGPAVCHEWLDNVTDAILAAALANDIKVG